LKDLAAHHLSRLPMFAALDPEEIDEIVDMATLAEWREGEVIFTAGQPAERFLLLLAGVVRPMRTTPEGGQTVPLHIPAGQLIGLAVAMGRDSYPATAVAATRCVTLSWPSRLWVEFSVRYEGFVAEAWHEIGARMEELHQRIEDLATRSAEHRIASALLRMARQAGRPKETGVAIGFPVTRATIAEMTGTTIFTVSRLLSAWEKQGIIASTRKHITLTDPARLEALCDTDGT